LHINYVPKFPQLLQLLLSGQTYKYSAFFKIWQHYLDHFTI